MTKDLIYGGKCFTCKYCSEDYDDGHPICCKETPLYDDECNIYEYGANPWCLGEKEGE